MSAASASNALQCFVCRKGVTKKETKTCSRCKHVVYCGKKCQLAHWKGGGHKVECNTAADDSMRDDNDDDDDECRCWICFGGKSDGPLVAQGCACRVDNGLGAAHFACLLTDARSVLQRRLENFDPDSPRPDEQFLFCRTCKQMFGPSLALRLARKAAGIAEYMQARGLAPANACFNLSEWAPSCLIDALVLAEKHAEAYARMKERNVALQRKLEVMGMRGPVSRANLVVQARLELDTHHHRLMHWHEIQLADPESFSMSISDDADELLADARRILATMQQLQGRNHDDCASALDTLARTVLDVTFDMYGEVAQEMLLDRG